MIRTPILASGLLACCLAFEGSACYEHSKQAKRAAEPARIPKALSPVWVGPSHSGSWYTASRNGEGFALQVLDSGDALVVWFTYPPAGGPGQQAWILAQGGRVDGDRIRFDNAFTTRGPRFGAQFDPAQVQILPWGTLEFRFTGCNSGEFTYAGPAAWGSGTREITRLTTLSELECDGSKRRLTASGARSLAGLRQRGGSWFDPSHNGEGWQVEELPDGRTQVYWFTYDELGEQAWTVGVAPTGGDRYEIAQNLRPVGTNFGSAFDASRVQLVNWGRVQFEFSGCDAGRVDYQSTLGAFGTGTLRPVRLTKLAGTACVEGTPSVPANGTWSQGANMPAAESEVAAAKIGSRSCVAGGFAGRNTFQCYDMPTNTWARLAPLPNGRDHALAVAYAGEMYVAGGNRGGSGDASISGWRYVEAEDRWEAVTQLPHTVQSSASMLDGFAYFGDVNGDLRQYNPRTRTSRRIPADSRGVGRDHAQTVAFQGEIWMIGGRVDITIENAEVSIYDPAAETWRRGPPLRTARAGFGAAATPSAIILGGGERLVAPLRVLATMESIAAGEDGWSALPAMPFPVHGVGAVIDGNAFYLLGGSRQAGVATNDGRVQVYRFGP